MFLEYLKIIKNGSVLRQIDFKKGINFIVDKTPITGGKETGNNVGKTTVLRLVDYCLGSKGKDIYSDSEFSASTNTNVKKFLEDNNVIVELGLIDRLEKPPLIKFIIQRNFLQYKDKILTVNGEKYTEDEFYAFLNKVIFNNLYKKPSFRSLIAKFIRDNSFKMSRTLRYLHQSTTDTLYESVHLFLLGISFDEDTYVEKNWLIEKISSEQKVQARLSEDFTENDLKQAISIIERDISVLSEKKKNFNLDNQQESEIDKLNNLRFTISSITSRLSEFEFRLKIINESASNLKSGSYQADLDTLESIYTKAKSFIPSLQKEFSAVVSFHNSMIENKIKYISREIPALEDQISQLRNDRKLLIIEENTLNDKLRRILNTEEYNDIITELNKKYELKGQKEERLNQINELNLSIDEKNKRLDEINSILKQLSDDLDKKLLSFNEYFSNLSRTLYEEEYFLSYDKVDSNYKFKISNIEANIGGGKKKGQIAAFDLAYIEYCDANNIKSPRFILHDSPEDISINQLFNLIEIANNIECQFIVSVLNDKFASSENFIELIELNKVLELSQSDKLFKF